MVQGLLKGSSLKVMFATMSDKYKYSICRIRSEELKDIFLYWCWIWYIEILILIIDDCVWHQCSVDCYIM